MTIREHQEREPELAARIARGDPAAEADLVDRFRRGLLVMLRRRVAGCDAEDLCQETLRVALENLRAGRLRDGEKLSAYLWGIADHLSRRVRERSAREHTAGDALELRVDQTMGPEESLQVSERQQLVRLTIERLPIRDRDILSAFYLTERSKEEICRSHGLTPPQFDVIKFRALKRFARALAEMSSRPARTETEQAHQ